MFSSALNWNSVKCTGSTIYCDRVWIFSLHQKYPSHCILLTMYGVHKKPWVREVFLCSPYFSRVCNLNFSCAHRCLPYWVPILMYGEHKKCFTTPWKIGVFLFDSSVSIVGSFWAIWAYYEMFSGHYCSLLLLREKHFFFVGTAIFLWLPYFYWVCNVNFLVGIIIPYFWISRRSW